MVRLLKISLAVLSMLLVVVVGIGLLAQYYVNTPEFIEQIRKSASQTLGAEVKFEQADVWIWSGFEIRQIEILPVNASAHDTSQPLLTVEEIKASFDPRLIFQRKLKLSSVHIVHPHFQLLQAEDGKWNLPDVVTFFKEISSIGLSGQRMPFAIDQLEIEHGELSASLPNGAPLINIQGANAEGHLRFLPSGAQAEGQVTFEAVDLLGSLRMKNAGSRLILTEDKIAFPDFKASAYGGQAEANGVFNYNESQPRYDLSLSLTGVALSDIFQAFGDNPGFAQGKLSLAVHLLGNPNQIRLSKGTGTLNVSQAVLSRLPALETLGDLLEIESFPQSQSGSVKGSFKVGDEKFTFYDLEALFETIRMTGSGSLDFEDHLNFDVMLAVHPKLAARIPKEMQSKFTKRTDDFLSITFNLTETLQNPITNLKAKLFGTPPSSHL